MLLRINTSEHLNTSNLFVLFFCSFLFCFVFSVGAFLLLAQLEEVRGVPASSEKAISEATALKEELEKQKVKEEEKLKEVMESLKEETSGLQQDKEVCVCIVFFVLFCFACFV